MQLRLTILTLLVTLVLLNTQAQWATSGTHIHNTNAGFVGIGTTTPAQRLHVEGSSNQAIFVSTTAPGATSGSGFIGSVKNLPTGAGNRLGYFLAGSRGGAQSGLNAAGIVGYSGGAWTAGVSQPAYLAFETTTFGQASRAERMRIAPNGNVGIGTTAPLQKLHINGNAQVDGSVGVGGAVNTSYALTVNTNGSLNGIEVTDPVHGSVLSCVKSGILSGIRIEKTATGTGTACITGNSTGSSPGLAGFSSTGTGVIGNSVNSYGIYGESSGPSTNEAGYAGRFISNNYRGIFAQGGNGFFAGYFNGSVFSTGTFQSSDGRLKKNIQDVNGAMELLNKLQPKLYEFRSDGQYALLNLPNGRHYGLLAEEVEKVLPEIVKDAGFNTNTAKPMRRVVEQAGKEITLDGEEKNGEDVAFKAINYTEFTPIIIKALQEHDAQNKAREERLNRLEEENADIKRQLAELMQMVSKLANGQNINASLGGAALLQNVPNPVKGSTSIQYSIPDGSFRAQLLLTDAMGRTIKAIQLTSSGVVNLDVSTLSSGVYNYSLVVDGKSVQTRKMIVQR